MSGEMRQVRVVDFPFQVELLPCCLHHQVLKHIKMLNCVYVHGICNNVSYMLKQS